MQPLSPVTELQPATDSSDFSEMVLEVLRQLAKVPSSFVSLLQERQMQGLAALCSRVDVQDREVVYHDGDDSGFLGIILCGKFNLTMHGHVLLDLQVGDIVGELELCNPRGGSSCRQHTLIADGRSVVARITFDGFEAFIESMGPRHAKRLSRLLAEYALTKVVKEEEDAVQQDRNRLETIGSTRRMAFSNACRTDLFWNVDVDDPGESNVPFYFQKETERWPNMEKAIDAVMSRVPMLMCLDVDMKNKVKSTFLVATKKIGQFIAHKGQRLDYFFIIYRGECGNYAQLTAAGSRPPSALSHHVLPSSPLHTTDRFSVHKSPPRSESLVMTRTDSNATAATSVSKTSDVVQSQHRQIQSPPEQLRQLAQSPSVGPRRFPLSSVGAHEASVRGTTRSIGTPTLGPTSSALATHTPPIDDANFSRTSSGGTVSDVAYSIAASKKASGKLARNKSKVQYELLSTIEEGRWFGEMGLIVESKSDMNIKALSEVVLLMLPTKAFRDLRDGYEKKMFHLRSRLVKGAPFGKFLDRERTCKVADALVQRHYQAGDSVINAESTDFFILQSGVAVEMKQDTARDSSPGRASPLPTLPRSSSPVTRAKPGQRFLTDKDPNTIREHHDGSCFCEWNLNVQNIDSRSWEISAVPLNPLVFAKTDCIFLVLDRKTFIDVIGSYDALINGKDAAEDLERHEVEKSVQNKRKFKTAGFPSSAALGNANASSSRRLSQGSFGSSRRSSLNESTAPSGSVSSSLPLPPNGQKNEATVSLNENSREEGKGNHSASSEIVGMDGMDVILPLPVPCKSEFNDSTNDGHSNLLEHEETSLMVRDDGSLHMIREQSEDFNWTPLPKKSSPLPQAVRSPLSGTGNTMATPIAITEKDATSSLEVFKEVDVPHSLWLKKETKGIDVGDTEVNFDLEIDSELDPEIRAIAEEMVRTMFLEASAEASDLPLSEALNCLAGDKTELEKSGHGQRHAERPQDLEEEIAVETNLFTLIEGPQSPHSGSSGSEQISTFNSPRTQNSTIYRHVATPVSSALADVAGRLNEHITLDDSLPMHRNSSRPNTSERKDFMSNSGSEEGRESGNLHQIRPSTSSKAPESSIPYSPALSKVGNSSSPNTPILGVSGRWNRPGSTGSYSIWPGAGTAGEPHTNRRETPDSRFGIDPPTLSRPMTQGSLPRTPGGNVIMNPQGWQSIPSFKSPAMTPSQSRSGSRQQSRKQSRQMSRAPSLGSHAESSNVHFKMDDRRSRASTSHLITSDNEFFLPTGHSEDPTLQDLYDSDDDDREQYSDTLPSRPITSISLERNYSGAFDDEDDKAEILLFDDTSLDTKPTHKPGTPDPNALITATTKRNLEQQQMNAFSQIRSDPIASQEKKLVSSPSGRGSWALDTSAQHPFLDYIEKEAAQLPGPGQYPIPRRHMAGGRISDAQPLTHQDYKLLDAYEKPGPLEYAPFEATLPRGGRFNPSTERLPPPGSHASMFSVAAYDDPRIGPGSYEIVSTLGQQPTMRMSTAQIPSIIAEIARKRGSATPGPGQYRIVRDQTDGMRAAKDRLAKMKKIADRCRKRAATVSEERAHVRSANPNWPVERNTKTPLSVSVFLDR